MSIFSSRFSGNLVYGPQPIIELDFGPAAPKGCRPLVYTLKKLPQLTQAQHLKIRKQQNTQTTQGSLDQATLQPALCHA